MAELTGKTVIVLGGTSGIGLATARLAAARGARVIAAARSATGVENASAESPNIIFEQVDATDANAVEQLLETQGGVDHVFVTAGRVMNDPTLTGDAASQAETLETRFWSAVNVARASAKHLRAGGSVVFTSGVAAKKPIAGEAFAAASCAAVEALARQLAVDMKPTRFNAIAPGLIDTPLLKGFFGGAHEAAYVQFASVIPVGRVGKPADAAHAVLFLMENDYVNGISLLVDGGFHLT